MAAATATHRQLFMMCQQEQQLILNFFNYSIAAATTVQHQLFMI
jgi:hypothetical protein